MRRSAVLTLAALAALPAAVRAQPVPGSEFRVNGYTTNVQAGPRMDADAAGNVVVVWESDGQDGSGRGIVGRRFSAGGRPLSAEFLVTTYTTGLQDVVDVAAAPDGGFMVVWGSLGQDGDGRGIFGRRFSAAGVPVGAEFQANDTTTGHQSTPLVDIDASGNALVTWIDHGGLSFGRLYDPAGNHVGAELTLGIWFVNDVESTPGGFVITGGDLARQVFVQRLNASGAPLAPPFQLASGGRQYWPMAAVDPAGGFVVVWQDQPVPMGPIAVLGRRFDAAGTPLGAAFQVSASASLGERPSVSMHPDGRFVVVWGNDAGQFDFDIAGRRFDASGVAAGAEFRVNVVTDYLQVGPVVEFSPGGHIFTSWSQSDIGEVSARQFGLVPSALVVDRTANGVLEPGETAAVETAWANLDMREWSLDGAATSWGGPGSPGAYALVDAVAQYGSVPDGVTTSCEPLGNCYAVSVSAGPRPAAHWDASLREELSSVGVPNGAFMQWTVHVGDSFTDVPRASTFYRFVETLLHNGVTAGCSAGTYCPGASTARDQMAALVLGAKEGAGYSPPPCGTPLFADVPASSPFCPFVEELARRGVVGGCGGGAYCAAAPVTRREMAVLVLLTAEPGISPPPCGTPRFDDVPAASPFCPWIEELARRGVAAGCGGGSFCPAAEVTRQQTAVFVAAGFGLALYGP